MGKYETKNSSSVVRSFGAASAEMFQPEVNASSYQIRRRYFRLQKFIRLCIEMRYLVIFISMVKSHMRISGTDSLIVQEIICKWVDRKWI